MKISPAYDNHTTLHIIVVPHDKRNNDEKMKSHIKCQVENMTSEREYIYVIHIKTNTGLCDCNKM